MSKKNRLFLFTVLLLGGFSLPLYAQKASKDDSRARSFEEFTALYARKGDLAESLNRYQRMNEMRVAAQASLEALMKKQPSLDLQLRYGEMMLEHSRELSHFSMELALAGEEKKSLELSKESKQLATKGLQHQEKLLKKVQKHPLLAELYLGVARTRLILGFKQEAFNDADAGIRAAQGKPGIETTLWIVRGDAAFEMARAAQALESYTKAKVLAEKGGLDSSYITYKIAWSHFNLKDSDEAVKNLEELIDASNDRFALKQEAVQDYALFASDLSDGALVKRGGVEGIYSYLLKASDENSARKALDQLGKFYAKNGRRSDAIRTLEHLISQKMLDPKNVDRALTIVEWSSSFADKSKLSARYEWLLSEFGPKSKWFKAHNLQVDVQKNAYTRIEASLRNYALSLHQSALKESNEELRKKAEVPVAALYDAYLEVFTESHLIHYYRAEIYRREKNYARAGDHYDSFLKIYETTPKDSRKASLEKIKEDAAWGSIQVWAKAIDKDKSFVPSMLRSADYFLKAFPKHPQAAQVLLDAAKVELKSGQAPLALTRIQTLTERYPKTEQVFEGVNAALDILAQEKDYVNLSLKARAWLKSSPVWAVPAKRVEVEKELRSILAKTEAKACEILNQRPNAEMEAALCFEGFAKDFSKDPLAPKSLLVAAEIYDKLKKSEAALDVLQTLVKKYPDSDVAISGFSRLATVFEKNFEFERSVEIFENLLKRSKEFKERERLAMRLLVILRGLGRDERVEALLKDSVISEKVRSEFFAERARYNVIVLNRGYLQSGAGKEGFRSPEAAKAFKELAQSERALPLAERLEFLRFQGILQRESGDRVKAESTWALALKDYWKSSHKDAVAKEAAARLRLEQSSLLEKQFHSISVEKNPARKTELYQKLEGIFSEVIAMKTPVVALEAIMRSAQMSRAFGEELKVAAARAKGEEKKVMENAAIDLEKKSAMFIREVAVRAREWKIISPAVLQAFASLKPGSDKADSWTFAWGEMPRWIQLGEDERKWREWNEAQVWLDHALEKSRVRSEERRASFVTLFRMNSLKDPKIALWSRTMPDKAGIQLRIQALINDKDFNRATLFTNQYEEFYGVDSFSSFIRGQIEWGEGNYSRAFAIWMNGESGKEDFRTLYWKNGWLAMIDEIIGGDQEQFKKESFIKLKSVAQEPWEKYVLVKLCLRKQLNCEGYSVPDMSRDAMVDPDPMWFHEANYVYVGHKRDALYELALYNLQKAQSSSELTAASPYISELASLLKLSEKKDRVSINQRIDSLKRAMDERTLHFKNSKREVAEVKP